MQLDDIDLHLPVYRATMKLLSLQKRCFLDIVFVRHITAAFQKRGGALLSREDVTCALNKMFLSASQDVPGHMTSVSTKEACHLLFSMFDRRGSGHVSSVSLQTALMCLSAESLLLKYKALVCVAEDGSGCITRSSVRSLLEDICQVPAAVQEDSVFGSVEEAVQSCFDGVRHSTLSGEHLLSWLQNHPHLLWWLPTLQRLSAGQQLTHAARCHTCKTRPFTGLRYRCVKCVNVQVCQSCFLNRRQTGKHKSHHPLLEYCSQSTWREHVSSLAHSARHALLPRRFTRVDVHRRRSLMWMEPPHRSLPPSVPLAASPADESTVLLAPPTSSKALQTEEVEPEQDVLLTEVRNLQTGKWLLEQELHMWKLTVQSDQGMLEERCSEMEVAMKTMRGDNLCLQGALTQALNQLEDLTHGKVVTLTAAEETQDIEDEWSNSEEQTPADEVHWEDEEEELTGDSCPDPVEDEVAEGVEPGKDEDSLTVGPEERLQDAAHTLKTTMDTQAWTHTHTGDRDRAELLLAAEQVGGSIHHLVDTVRTHKHTFCPSVSVFYFPPQHIIHDANNFCEHAH